MSLNGGVQYKSFSRYPEDVGILAMEVYFPAQYVDQSKLEAFDNVSAGKYTIGLGQSKMSFCTDNEDINSICLTVLNNLMEKYQIKPSEIGRLDVGTETLIDKSKSVKSSLMRLFEESGNTDIEGVDNVNACFGGTAALFNAVNWIESSYWDGRYAAVVMGDIALYAKGSARPTGGAGSVAFLIGPNAPIVLERGLRATHISHAYDFYKPEMDSEYPYVDGKLSVVCYLNALDKCYQMYKKKFKSLAIHKLNDLNNNKKLTNGHIESQETKNPLKPDFSSEKETLTNGDRDHLDEFNLNSAQAFLFHSPYCKLVQKSFARLLWNDYLDSANQLDNESLEKFKNLSKEESYMDKDLEKELMRLSTPLFNKKTSPSLLFAKEIGNMYTPSLYGCLASYLLSKPIDELVNGRVCLFSYGSGLASSMFSMVIGQDKCERFTLSRILENLGEQKKNLLENRIEIEPALYDAYLNQREKTHKKPGRHTQFAQNLLFSGTWSLLHVDDKYRRTYDRFVQNFDRQYAERCLNEKLSKINLFKRNEAGFTDSSYIKTTMVAYTPEEGFGLQITGFNEYGFTINNKIRAIGPIVIFPKTIYSWNVEDHREINEKSLKLFTMLEPKIDILIIGTGDNYAKVDPEVPKWLIKNKISNFEILRTDKAINAFNFLIAENRFVAAALIPALIKREGDKDARRVIERAEMYQQLETKSEESLKEKQFKQAAIDYDRKNNK